MTEVNAEDTIATSRPDFAVCASDSGTVSVLFQALAVIKIALRIAELNQFWAGNSIVQPAANAGNHAAATYQAKTNEIILNQVI